MRHYIDVHRMAITCCVYSPTAKVVVTGSLDTEVKVWSLAGGLLETFRGHSKAITKIILNPYNSNLIISSSLDGIIKMWSLDIMQPIYQLNLSDSEIYWMGVTDDNSLYVATSNKITIWRISNFIEFWALSR